MLNAKLYILINNILHDDRVALIVNPLHLIVALIGAS